jgi:hypothetical protein
MAEPTSTGAVAAASGIVAVFLATVGVHPHIMIAAVAGSVFGMPSTGPEGRLRANLVFLAVVLSSAELAQLAAVEAFRGSIPWGQGVAVCLGVFFHQLAALISRQLPNILERVLRIFASKGTP